MSGGTFFMYVALASLVGLVVSGLQQDLVWAVVSGFVGVISAVFSMGDAIWQQLEKRRSDQDAGSDAVARLDRAGEGM